MEPSDATTEEAGRKQPAGGAASEEDGDMKRFWARTVAVILVLVAAEVQAGPPQLTAPSRTTEVRRQDDLAPLGRPAITRGSAPDGPSLGLPPGISVGKMVLARG